MVFCCDPFEPLSPEEEAAAVAANNNASAPICGEDPELVKTDNAAKKLEDLPHPEDEGPVLGAEILVSVTLPPGVSPGQKIEVRSPDGKRTVDTIVPEGLEIGQTFLVRFPPAIPSEQPVTTLPSIPAEETPKEARNDETLMRGNEGRAKQNSLSETLERFLIPTPDPPVNRQRKDASPRRSPISAPTPEGSANTPRPISREVDHSNLPRSNSPRPISPALSPELETLPSTSLKRVEGSPVEATVTPVETRQEGDDTRLHVSESQSETEQEETESDEDSVIDEERVHTSSPKHSNGKNGESGGLNLVRSLEDFLTPKPDQVQPSASARSEPAHLQKRQGYSYNQRLQQKIMQRHHHSKHTRSHQQHREPYQYQPPVQPARVQQPGQKLVMVQVPPDMPPGSTIFVEIPLENRTVAAQVPPNVTTFHVAYTPQGPPRPTPPPQARAVVLPPRSKTKSRREKLLSVKVPPGTPPGTTLHVSVPDEPGRILAAKVPPGNVTKFHVSYVPTDQHTPTNRRMLPPANAYRSSDPYQHQHSGPKTESRDHREFFGDSYESPMARGGDVGSSSRYGSTYPNDSVNYSPYITGDNLGATTSATEGWGDYGF